MPSEILSDTEDIDDCSQWWAKIIHPDGKLETVQVYQFVSYRPKDINDNNPNVKHVVLSDKGDTDGKMHEYKTHVLRLGKTKQLLEVSIKTTRLKIPVLKPSTSDFPTTDADSDHEGANNGNHKREKPAVLQNLKRKAAERDYNEILHSAHSLKKSKQKPKKSEAMPVDIANFIASKHTTTPPGPSTSSISSVKDRSPVIHTAVATNVNTEGPRRSIAKSFMTSAPSAFGSPFNGVKHLSEPVPALNLLSDSNNPCTIHGEGIYSMIKDQLQRITDKMLKTLQETIQATVQAAVQETVQAAIEVQYDKFSQTIQNIEDLVKSLADS